MQYQEISRISFVCSNLNINDLFCGPIDVRKQENVAENAGFIK
jgi:hypothetical protein